MYIYEYERVYVKGGLVLSRTINHREIINSRAKDGWRYVGFIPAAQSGQGSIGEMDLIFEKEV